MDDSAYQAITSGSLTSKTVLIKANLQDLTYMVILMPWTLIKSLLTCTKKKAQPHATLEA